MAISAIASVAGGLIQGSGARRAARAQEAAAQRDLDFQRETRDLIFDRLDPFLQPGIEAQNALRFEFGLGPRPTVGGTAPQVETFTETLSMGQPAAPMSERDRLIQAITSGATTREAQDAASRRRSMGMTAPQQPQTRQRFRVGGQVFDTMEQAQAFANANRTGGTEYRGFQATPGFQFQLEQGQGAVNALAGARGGLNSGRTLQDLATFNQGLASQEYNNFITRLTGMAGAGQNAAGAQANAATNAATGVSNALSGIGNAQSAGIAGQASAINQGITNALALREYQRGVNPGNAGMTFGSGSWARGMTGNQLLPPRF